MKLDSRIKDGKKPLDCFDTEIAKQFIGKKGLFGVHKSQFMNLDTCPKCVNEILNKIDNYDECSFVTSGNYAYMYFLPEEWVKEPEKKYRPYSLNEFLNEHEIGDKITYRHKMKEQPENFIRHKEMICGYQIVEGEANTPGEGLINLGGVWISLQAMFDDCETPNSYLYPEVWEPFGVIDDEKK